MTEIISVQFRKRGRNYSFKSMGHRVAVGQSVIVETVKGPDIGQCTRANVNIDNEKSLPPLRPVLRIATEQDLRRAAENEKIEQVALPVCKEKARALTPEMKVIDVECSFDGMKLLVIFSAEDRVDFRALVRELASALKKRIEMRQIGIRDEAKLLGGLGPCGKEFCCTQFLDRFAPVSIRMAKTQNLSLNPTKISGTCGRLMCCLKHEQEAYEELVKGAPKSDSYVETPDGTGTITEVNLLRQKAKVRMETKGDTVLTYYPFSELTFIKSGKQRRAEIREQKAEMDAQGTATGRPSGRDGGKPNRSLAPQFGEKAKSGEKSSRPPRPRFDQKKTEKQGGAKPQDKPQQQSTGSETGDGQKPRRRRPRRRRPKEGGGAAPGSTGNKPPQSE